MIAGIKKASVGQMRAPILLEDQRRFHRGSSMWTELTYFRVGRRSERQGLRMEGRKSTPNKGDSWNKWWYDDNDNDNNENNGDVKHSFKLTIFQVLF